jgi:subtilisin family serine protease
MRAQRSVLLLIAVTALLTSGAGGAFAQKYYGRGGQNFHASRPVMPARPGRDRGWHHGGWRGPGIVVSGSRGEIIEEDYAPRPRRHVRRRSPRRSASGAPPAGEHRLLPDEVVIEVANSLSGAQIEALRRRHRLTRIEQQRFALSGTTLVRWRIPDGRSVRSVIRALERDAAVISAQPNYLFTLQQDDGGPPAPDPAQYELAKLRLPQAHALATGKDIRVAVIDSGVDVSNRELIGSIAGSFDALGKPGAPHAHGTGIASLIAGHGKLTGAAPGARILAVRAFAPDGAGAQGNTFDILKGLDWAVAHEARVINMSFAGPRDPALQRSLAAAHRKGVVLVAAAGNGGPNSPPLYPAADPDVIAVTATDAGDRLLPQANRGRYIDVAAPGAQILVAVPGGYAVSSGTSYAAAEVSGIAALMLQREPRLGPDRLRDVLMETAKDLGPRGRDSLFGAGLADAFGALMTEGPLTAAAPAHQSAGTR